MVWTQDTSLDREKLLEELSGLLVALHRPIGRRKVVDRTERGRVLRAVLAATGVENLLLQVLGLGMLTLLSQNDRQAAFLVESVPFVLGAVHATHDRKILSMQRLSLGLTALVIAQPCQGISGRQRIGACKKYCVSSRNVIAN